MKTVVTIPNGARVLVVEDSAYRISWFRERLLNPAVATNKQDALELLRDGAPYDVVFLDHDAVPVFWAEGDEDLMTFYDVATRLQQLKYSGKVILHSLNSYGRYRMMSVLQRTADVVDLPYGTFEIEHDYY